PPEWTVEKILEFPGSVNGPWARYLECGGKRSATPLLPTPASQSAVAADALPAHSKVGLVCYPRLEPRDADCAARLKKRTLTNLYNQRPAWLQLAYKKLDAAVAAAYSWNDFVEILEHTEPGEVYDFEGGGGWLTLD